MEPELDERIEQLVDEVIATNLSNATFEELAEKHAKLRDMITENNARQRAADMNIKICTAAIEAALGERLAAVGVKSAVVPSGRFKVSTEPKIVYNTTDPVNLVHWAVKNHKEHLLSVSLVSSACIAAFDNIDSPQVVPDFICKVEVPQTKVTRN